MNFQCVADSPLAIQADLLVVFCAGAPAKDSLFGVVDKALDGHLAARAKEEHFHGKPGQILRTDRSGLAASAVAVIGAGDLSGFDPAKHRDLAATALRVARRAGAKRLAIALPQHPGKNHTRTVELMVEGALEGTYRFRRYRSSDKQPLSVKSVFLTADRGRGKKPRKQTPSQKRSLATAIKRAEVLAAAVCHARDMVNTPAADMTPSDLANEAKKVAKAHGLTIKVLGRAECKKMGMGMFLAVGQGSSQEPKFIHMTYKPRKSKGKVALIGKGITFDTGGYSLKPSQAMEDMKTDMAGSAAVIASMATLKDLGCPYEVHAVVASCENMVSGSAYKLGDVLTGMDGTTVEINNTDAEGRLTLADALTYARTHVKPDRMFDFATLTGACVIALGPHMAGVMADDQQLAKDWLAAAESAGEDMWLLPLSPRLREQLKSPLADLRNTGERWGGAITAGLFLRHFTRDTPWVHVDIAGPSSATRESGATTRGGTGFAVTTMVEYLTR